MNRYDLVVLDAGPASQKAAIAAAKLGHTVGHGGTVDYLRDAVFNYPTLAEAYEVAALDGLNRC